MVFSSLEFLFFFLPLFLVLYYIVPFKAKNFILLCASLIFYGWGEPVYIFLLIFLSVVGYVCCRVMERFYENGLIRKTVVVISVIACLSFLGYFKYAGFIVQNLNRFPFINIEFTSPALPIGISFFSFQILSCCIDVYRGNVEAEKSLINFVCYVSMFPQLIAGPIVRFSDICRELHSRKHSLNNFLDGASRFLVGIFKKVLIADRIGALWAAIKAEEFTQLSVLSAWVGLICIAIQLYYDFSGYGDMAIGMGKMMGFNYLENFDYPIYSDSITEFWRRWHMSLSSWFRDYVYIPFGGNRKGTARHIINMFIVWGLTGIWHGAEWNFLIWGLYYACFLVGEKYIWGNIVKRLPFIIRHIYSAVIIFLGFAIFDLTNISEIICFYKSLFMLNGNPLIDTAFLYNMSNSGIVFVTALIYAAPVYKVYMNWFSKLKKGGVKYTIWLGDCAVRLVLFAAAVSFMVSSSFSPFLYFRF
ncbi:MAG: MBOAT family protein [Clostridiales bacterium]|nr:MBOAT family protein [Clostridiales bacterium]